MVYQLMWHTWWGQKGGACPHSFYFITQDPSGVLIDIITPIPPSAEFLAQYQEEAAPA